MICQIHVHVIRITFHIGVICQIHVVTTMSHTGPIWQLHIVGIMWHIGVMLSTMNCYVSDLCKNLKIQFKMFTVYNWSYTRSSFFNGRMFSGKVTSCVAPCYNMAEILFKFALNANESIKDSILSSTMSTSGIY